MTAGGREFGVACSPVWVLIKCPPIKLLHADWVWYTLPHESTTECYCIYNVYVTLTVWNKIILRTSFCFILSIKMSCKKTKKHSQYTKQNVIPELPWKSKLELFSWETIAFTKGLLCFDKPGWQKNIPKTNQHSSTVGQRRCVWRS